MKYDLEAVADELMLTPEDLKEIFYCYFEGADELIENSLKNNGESDYVSVAKNLHALKGSSMNLRMHHVVELVIELSNFANQQQSAEIAYRLPIIKQEIEGIKKQIDAFYNKPM